MYANLNVQNDPGWDLKELEIAYKEFCKKQRPGKTRILLKDLAGCLRFCGADPVIEADLEEAHFHHKNVSKDEIDFKQFVEVMNEYPTPSRKIFNMFDKDGNGTISVDEMKCVLQELDPELTDEDVLGLFAETDEDGNGTVDYLEFKSVFGDGSLLG